MWGLLGTIAIGAWTPEPALAQDDPLALESTPSAGVAFLASAVVPGLGQRLLGQKRGWAYLGLEAVGWVAWWAYRAEAGGLRDDYRDLAWQSARTFDGNRMDGDFEYYERLLDFERSGRFDAGSAPGIQPEEDVGTFNGDAWALARQIHFSPGTDPQPGEPAYERALDFYRDRAVETAFEWDWSGKADERAEYARLIDDSDAAFDDASTVAGGIVLNHLVSALDAFLSSRASKVADRPIRFSTRFDPPRGWSRGRVTWGVGIGIR